MCLCARLNSEGLDPLAPASLLCCPRKALFFSLLIPGALLIRNSGIQGIRESLGMSDTITAFTPNREIIANIQNNSSLQAEEMLISEMHVLHVQSIHFISIKQDAV